MPRFRVLPRPHLTTALVLTALLLAGCSSGPEPRDLEALAQNLDIPACENDRLTDFERLLVIAPHPDDEILGFAGLTDAFLQAGKPVRTLIVTDGDAYCEACTLWTTGSVFGTPCSATQLSNFATPEVDSLAEARRQESLEAAARIGAPVPEFLGYPDTGVAFARAFRDAGQPATPLRRSDFSACSSCGDCGMGYAGGPLTNLSADTLALTLEVALEEAGPGTLVATTHDLDGHPDHAATAAFVRAANARLARPHALAFAVIHAHTTKDHAHPDCWYPAPVAEQCPCFDEDAFTLDPNRLTALREARRHPEWPQRLPDDVDYGEPLQLCLGTDISLPDGGRKANAIEALETQLGTTSLQPGVLPGSLEGLMDCSGYLGSFGRQTEVFVLETAGGE